jgi:hypothetical protein
LLAKSLVCLGVSKANGVLAIEGLELHVDSGWFVRNDLRGLYKLVEVLTNLKALKEIKL